MAKASTRTITFGRGTLPGNPHEALFEASTWVVAQEQRTANLIALLNTPGLPDADRLPLFNAVYKHLGITVTEPDQNGPSLNL